MTLYSPPVRFEIPPSAAITACIVASRNTDTETLRTVSTVRRLFRPRFLVMSRRYFIDASRSRQYALFEMQHGVRVTRRARVVSDHDDSLVKLFVEPLDQIENFFSGLCVEIAG